jgi:hypothetical protein
MMVRKGRQTSGLTLLEALLATFLGVLVVAGAVKIFISASRVSTDGLQRTDIQQSARGALGIINRDLGQAANGIPPSGIPVPPGALFACGPVQGCLLAPNNIYPNNILSPVTPGQNKGPNGTDVVTIAYLDATWPVNNQNLVAINATGTAIVVNPGTFDLNGNPATPAQGGRAYNDPIVGTRIGDVLMLQNGNAAVPAIATVTAVAGGGQISLANGDPLNLNQPGQPSTISALANPSPPAPVAGTFPQTTASRINVVTYFIRVNPGGIPVLMRQLNAFDPIPLADNVNNLVLTYDIFNPNVVPPAPPYTANLLGGAVGNPSQIRKVTITMTLTSPTRDAQGNFNSMTVTTAVSPRDLSFSNRFQ